MTDIWQQIGAHIAAALNKPFSIERHDGIGGGCISRAHVVSGGGERYFVKLNDARMEPMFAAEAKGLDEIAATGTVTVPRPLCRGTAGDTAYLVMEYLALGRSGTDTARSLGVHLAAMHRVTCEAFGWTVDNYIGSTPQVNSPERDWSVFWQRHRLGYQLETAAANGYRGRLADRGWRLVEGVPALLAGHAPPASLLHGDLWSGNWAGDGRGDPVVFDPAAYYGDRETDLAMTELFGGFPAAFYEAYRGEYPLDAGYGLRKDLYNLYHVLNHLNLFGTAYLSQAQRLIDRLLGACRT